jgi:16S rRNA (guanine527-N7)-methyltransferase
LDISFDFKEFALRCRAADPDTLEQRAVELYRLLSAYNAETNLTRISSEQEYWIKHVADSLSAGIYFPELTDRAMDIADVGCGAGFPALILAAAFPLLRITAIDSIGKKTRFVELAARELGLDNVQIVTARSKELIHKQQWQDRFDVVTARAVAEARKLFRETRPLLRSQGRFIFYKTPAQIQQDLPQVAATSDKSGFQWHTTTTFELPDGGGSRQFLFT